MDPRPDLARVLAHTRRSKSTLVVAKLDRLARNVAFTSALMRSGVDFLACDDPHANKLTIHILTAEAEDEAERISARTKAALGRRQTDNGNFRFFETDEEMGQRLAELLPYPTRLQIHLSFVEARRQFTIVCRGRDSACYN